MARFIYNLLFPFALIFFLPGFILKMIRRGNYRHKFGQRLGIYDADLRQKLADNHRTWIHAVSVGEVAIALKLAGKMRELDPNSHFVLTTTTTTGFALASRSARDWLEVMYNPLDFWPVIRRAFGTIQPARIILVEAEVWPNLVAIAHAKKIPVALVNARLSPRSERRFRKFRFAVAPTFRCLDLICVQELADIERWTALGIAREKIECVGSIKFDSADAKIHSRIPRDVLRALQIEDAQPILFGGSTHAREEEILARVFLRLRREFPSLFLVIAPRHVERVAAIRAQLEALSLRVELRSRERDSVADCLLLDTTGELQNWYAIATVVFVGKSLTAHGGQNPAEPMVAGKPVVFGPNMENFSELARSLVREDGAVQIQNEADLENSLAKLLRDPERRARLVANARSILAKHAGATARTAALVLAKGDRK